MTVHDKSLFDPTREQKCLVIAQKSLDKLADTLGVPTLAELPLFIENNLKGAIAHTNPMGVWIRRDVLMKDARNAGTYVCHEIMHHVVHNHELTGMYDHFIVNVGEDYWINYWQNKLWGLDVRKVKFKGLYHGTWGKKSPHEICALVVARNAKYYAKHGKLAPKQMGCGCNGIAHPAILRIAEHVRKKFDLGLKHRQGSLIVHDKIDDADYQEILPKISAMAKLDLVRTDLPNLTKGLWMKAYLDNPKSEPVHHVLNVQQALTYCWDTSHFRHNTVGDKEKAALAAAIYLKIVNKHQSLLDMRVFRILDRIGTLKNKIKTAKQNLRKRMKVLKSKAILKKSPRLLKEQEKKLKTARKKQEWPINRMLQEYPVNVAKTKSFIATTIKSQKRKQVSETPQIVPIQPNITSRTLKWLSNLSSKKFEEVLEFEDMLREAFGNIIDQLDQEAREREEREEQEGEEQEQEDTEGEGDGEGSGEGEERDEDEDQPNLPPKSGGSGGKRDPLHNSLVNTLFEFETANFNLIRKILSHMQDFETALEVKKNSRTDPLVNTLDLIPSVGGELERVDAGEFALLDNEMTRLSFYSKLADGSLSIRLPQENKRQPVAMCVDASGSMANGPYEMACGFVLAMLKKLASDKRGGAFIVFSTNVYSTIVLEKDKPFNLATILKVLLTPKYGGTCFDAALGAAYDIKKKQSWRAMTTMLITDGGDAISKPTYHRISAEKGPHDQITAVLVRGSDSGLQGLNDLALKVTKNNMQMVLTKLGNSVL